MLKNLGFQSLDWILWYRLAGVERFYLYGNNSTDTVTLVIKKIFVKEDFEFFYWNYNFGGPDNNTSQRFHIFHSNLFANCSMILEDFDVNEFIVPQYNASL